MKKSHKITIISSISAIALVAAAVISYPYIFNESPIQSTDSTSSVVSSAPSSPSSETTSNEVASNEVSSTIVVPEIEAPVSSEAPAVSSAPTEIKVEGSPTSKPSSTSSVPSKPKDTTPKPTTQVSSTPPAKPTGNGDIYDERTGTYPKIGDTMISPKSGVTLVWSENGNALGNGPGWMTTESSGKSGDSAGLDKDFMQDLYDQGYTGNDIGSDD